MQHVRQLKYVTIGTLRCLQCGMALFLITLAAHAEDVPREQRDPALYDFPFPGDVSAVRGDDSVSTLSTLNQIRNDLAESDYGDGPGYTPMSEEQYRLVRNNIQGVHDRALQKNVSPAIEQARRMLVVLDWQAGKLQATEAATSLERLAADAGGPREAGSHLGYSTLILLRNGAVTEAIDRFADIDEGATPSFGAYAFDAVRYLGDWVHDPITLDMRMTGQPFEVEHERSQVAVAFLKDVWIPKMERLLSNSNQVSDLEALQIADASEKAVEMVSVVLSRRLYLDISKATTNDILPKLANLLKLSSERFSEGAPWLQQRRATIIEKAGYITDELIPRIEDLQSNRQFVRDFADVLSIDEEDVIRTIETLDTSVSHDEAAREEVDPLPVAFGNGPDSQRGSSASLASETKNPANFGSKAWLITVIAAVGTVFISTAIVIKMINRNTKKV